jgi:hypothetical protein
MSIDLCQIALEPENQGGNQPEANTHDQRDKSIFWFKRSRDTIEDDDRSVLTGKRYSEPCSGAESCGRDSVSHDSILAPFGRTNMDLV